MLSGVLTRELPSAGAFYTYVTRGIGPRSGFVTGILMFLAYALLVPAELALIGIYSHDILAEYGVYVQPINYPTVPRGTERLRFTPGPAHDEAMMRELTDALVEIWDRVEMRKAA